MKKILALALAGLLTVSMAAVAYAIHDGENLYVYAEIADADMVDCDPAKQESAPWETDSFEIILDGSNTTADTLYQARVDWTGWASYYTNLGSKGGVSGYGPASFPGVQAAAAVEIDGGYAIEAALNLPKFAVLAGNKIGIHYQVNDMHSDGSGTVAHQPPLSLQFPRQEYCSG